MVKEKCLTRGCDHLNFCPDLINDFLGQIPRFVLSLPRHLHIPKTPVTCNVAKVSVLRIRRTKEDALTRVRGDSPAERGTVLIILTGNEGLYLFQVGLLHTRHLSDLMDPKALELLRCSLVIHIRKRQTVRKPLHGKLGDECRLADALIAIEDGNIVKLSARMINALVCCAQSFSGNCTDILIVVCTKIVDEQCLHTKDSIPLRQ